MGKLKSKSSPAFSEGDTVFAKVKGYSYWPARIEPTPNEFLTKDKYKIIFYGTYQTVDLKSDRIVSYNAETKAKYGKPRKQKSFMEAMWEIENDPELKKVNLKKLNVGKNGNETEAEESNEEEEDKVSSENEEDSSVESLEKEIIGKPKSKISPKCTKDNQNQSKEIHKTKIESIKKGSKSSTRDETKLTQSKINEQQKNIEPLESVNKSKTKLKSKSEASDSKTKSELKAIDEEKQENNLKKKVFLRTDSGRFMSTKNKSNSERNEKNLEKNEGIEVDVAKSSDGDSNQRRLSSRPKQPNKRYATDDEDKPLVRRFCPDENLKSKVKETIPPENTKKLKLKNIKPNNKRNNSSSRTSTISSVSLDSYVTEKEQIESEKTDSEKSTTDESEFSAKSETATSESKTSLKRDDSSDKMEWSTEDEEILSKYEKSLKESVKKAPEEIKISEADQIQLIDTKVQKSSVSSPAKLPGPQKSPLKNGKKLEKSALKDSSKIKSEFLKTKVFKSVDRDATKNSDEERKLYESPSKEKRIKSEINESVKVKENLETTETVKDKEEESDRLLDFEDKKKDKTIQIFQNKTEQDLQILSKISKSEELSNSDSKNRNFVDSESVNVIASNKSEKENIVQLRLKAIEDTKIRWSKMSPEEKEAEKKRIIDNKIKEKKLAKIRSIKIQMALIRMNVEIKKSLREDNMDVERCCLIMEDLIKLPITQNHLFNAPEIVETIRKCRKFKKSEKVKKIATESYYKFHFMFSILPGETFLGIFERERQKYLTENVEDLKKERLLAGKLQEKMEKLRANKTNKIESKTEPKRKPSHL